MLTKAGKVRILRGPGEPVHANCGNCHQLVNSSLLVWCKPQAAQSSRICLQPHLVPLNLNPGQQEVQVALRQTVVIRQEDLAQAVPNLLQVVRPEEVARDLLWSVKLLDSLR